MNTENLKPFQKGDDPRRQNGRKKGSKNISTIIRDLLNCEVEKIHDSEIRKLVSKTNSKTAKEAVVLAVLKKSLNGDIKATEWLCSYLDSIESPTESSFFEKDKLQIEIIDPKHNDTA